MWSIQRFILFFHLILARTNWIAFWDVISWTFGQRPWWISIFYFVCINLVVSRTWCFGVIIVISQLFAHHPSNFGKIFSVIVLIWPWPWYFQAIRIFQFWPKSITRVLFATIFKNSILIFIGTWAWYIPLINILSPFLWKMKPITMLIQSAFQIILAWS